MEVRSQLQTPAVLSLELIRYGLQSRIERGGEAKNPVSAGNRTQRLQLFTSFVLIWNPYNIRQKVQIAKLPTYFLRCFVSGPPTSGLIFVWFR
jgi:hypothetical protein